jgi:hypothetical protein
MTNAMLEKWKPEALKVEPIDNLPVPESVLVGEAVDVSKFCSKYWEARRDESGAVVLPGLELGERPGLFEKTIGSEIFELQEAVHAAHARYLLTVQAAAGAPMERAQFVLAELRSGLGFLFDDGVIDDNDARLERLAAAYDEAFSQDDVAAALDAYSVLGEQNRDKLAGLGGFDATVMQEAPQLAKQLRDRSGDNLIAPGSDERAALDIRNRLITLLWDRMSRVRAVARYVFRHHPELIRKTTSAYARRTRNKRNRDKAASAAVQPPEVSS